MSISLVITNLSAAVVSLTELDTDLGAAGSANASTTVTRSVAQIDSMDELKAFVHAGTVSVAATASSDNVDLLSIPIDQHGVVAALDVSGVAVVTSPVVFGTAFAIAPVVELAVIQSPATLFKAKAYARSLTASGFTIALDVTTAETGAVTAENPTMSPAENGVLLGPFTATLASLPLTSAALTLHWLESTVAKSATLTGTSTLGGVNVANLSAATINRTTGALSITFAGGHPPDTNSITIDYHQVRTADVHWVAKY